MHPSKRRKIWEDEDEDEDEDEEENYHGTAFGGRLGLHIESPIVEINPEPPNNVEPFPDGSEDEMVCFGVISDLDGLCEGAHAGRSQGQFPIQLDSARSFVALDQKGTRGTISQLGPLLQELIRDDEIQLDAFCRLAGTKPGKGARKHQRAPCRIDINLYGPSSFFDDLGEWLEKNDVYLQDPRYVVRDIKYCNPHRLSFVGLDSSPLVSQIVSQSSKSIYLRDIVDAEDFLDSYFSSVIDLDETEQPGIVTTSLKRHQKQALTFMLRREEGWCMQGPHADIWTIQDIEQDRMFVNTISQTGHQEPPPDMHGGIVADPMGLGKTLTMISLVATDFDVESEALTAVHREGPGRSATSATLIIVPPSLLDTWEKEIAQHTNGLRYRRHHGKTKFASHRDMEEFHVILTTYDTVAAEWKSSGEGSSSSVLFSTTWRRVIVDEAHVIRNDVSQRSKAICALDAHCRWAVTGTPIQNHLNDLATLLKFIRAHPYHEKGRFEEDITRLLKDEVASQDGVARLQRLSSCLLLRRPKKTIPLPARHPKECPVDFTPEEREKYDELKNRAIMTIDMALEHAADMNRSGVYVNMLQQIESLRLFCDLGLQYHTRHDVRAGASQDIVEWASIAQQAFNSHLEMGSVFCSVCGSIQSLTDLDNVSETAGPRQQKPHFSRCLMYVCTDCCTNLARNRRQFQCEHTPACPFVPVETGVYILEDVSEATPMIPRLLDSVPSKVAALVTDIQAQPFDVKCIVFSSWRLTLNVVEAGLEQAGIRCERFDGKVPQNERQPVLDRFRTDPSVRVLLLTLACGNFGLTLTEASRAYLMEPHWNPTIEEQAFGRIHRMGQTKEVTTIRFFIRDSFEEHVMEVQESKKELAGIFLSPHDGGQANSSIERLRKLRSLL